LGVFSKEFAQAKQVQWRAFRSRMKLEHSPELFSNVLDHLALFLSPCAMPDQGIALIGAKWIAPGPWIAN
jgi:hypothetical protein